MSFDGVNDYVTTSVPMAFADPNTKDFTIETWISLQGTGTSRVLHSQGSTSSLVSLLINSSRIPYMFIVVNGTNYSFNTQTQLPLNTWSHLAFTWDASAKQGSFYINGAEVSTISGGTSTTGTNNVMAIGARSDGTQNLNGTLDELRIWNNLRTECEISANFTTIINSATNLVNYYDFNSGVAGGTNTGITTLTDLVGTNNGTLQNFALTGNTSNWVSSGATIYTTGVQSRVRVENHVSVCYGDSYTFPDLTTVSNITSPQTNTTLKTGTCDSTIVIVVTPWALNQTNLTDSVCFGESYTFPDGGVLNNITAAVTDTSYFTDANSCDSLVIVSLLVNPTYFQTVFDTICQGDSYTYPDGNLVTNIQAPDTDTAYLQTVNGCDSTIVLNLSLYPTYFQTVSASVCPGDSYIYPDGNLVTNIQANDTDTTYLQTGNGCDSVIVLNLTLNPVYFQTITPIVCAGSDYVFPDGDTLFGATASLSDTSYLQTTLGCDSVIVVDLTVTQTQYTFIADTICSGDSYTLPSGTVLTNVTADVADTSYLVSLTNCDSVVYVALTVNSLPSVTVTANGADLTATGDNGNVAWYLDGNALSATDSTYTATVSGAYSVLATNASGCTAFSDTVNVTVVGIKENEALSQISAYLDPATSQLNVSIALQQSAALNLAVYDMAGKQLVNSQVIAIAGNTTHQLDMAALTSGLYLLQINLDGQTRTIKVVKH